MIVPQPAATEGELLAVVGELYPVHLEAALQTLRARKLAEFIAALPDPADGLLRPHPASASETMPDPKSDISTSP